MQHIRQPRANHLAGGAQNQNGLKRYASNTGWLLTEQILRTACSLLVGIYVARYLGPTNFGVYAYVITYFTVASAVSKLGMDSVIVQRLIEHPAKYKEYIATAFILKFCAGLFFWLAAFVISVVVADNIKTSVLVSIICAGLVFQAAETSEFYYQAEVQAKYISICRLTQLLVSSACKILLVFFEANIEAFVWIALMDQFSLAVFLTLSLKTKGISLFGPPDKKIAKDLLLTSLPLFGSALATMVYMRIDQFLIHSHLNETQLGIYVAATRLSEPWAFIPSIVCSSVFPAIVSSKNRPEAYRKRIRQLYALLIWISLAISLVISILADEIVKNLYGPAFTESATVLRIHIWGMAFTSILIASGRWLTAEGKNRAVFQRNLAGAAVGVICNITLIPLYGLKGAVASSIAALVFSSVLYDLLNKHSRGMLNDKARALFLRGVW